jgi:hypothetical protein
LLLSQGKADMRKSNKENLYNEKNRADILKYSDLFLFIYSKVYLSLFHVTAALSGFIPVIRASL